MTAERARPIVSQAMADPLKPISSWYTRNTVWWVSADNERAPREVIGMRVVGSVFLVLIVAGVLKTSPQPALHGEGLLVTIGFAAIVAGVVLSNPTSREISRRRRIAALLLVAAGGMVLEVAQPNGAWGAAPYFVAIIAAMRLDDRDGVLVLVVTLVPTAVVAIVAHGQWGAIWTVAGGALPWYFVLRLVRKLHQRQCELEASREAEARAAASAERGRMAREMHDVLAHSLSALALQLESTRLLARDRDADERVQRAIDQAHHIAAGGLEEARRAIAAMRGDTVLGPERLDDLVGAFREQSGLPVVFEVTGEPRDLPPDARLAVYRTAQEALTNVRKHAVVERVDVTLEYRPDATVLQVRDHGAPGVPAAVGAPGANGGAPGGYGLTGMRERAELLGGRLRAEPADDGFRVELWLPATAT